MIMLLLLPKTLSCIAKPCILSHDVTMLCYIMSMLAKLLSLVPLCWDLVINDAGFVIAALNTLTIDGNDTCETPQVGFGPLSLAARLLEEVARVTQL